MKQYSTLLIILVYSILACSTLKVHASEAVWKSDGGVQLTVHGTEVKAYPNPFTDQLTIDISVSQSSVVHFTVTDLLGNTLLSEKASFSEGRYQHRVNTSSLASGYYFMAVEVGGERIVKRVMKK